MHQFRLVSIPFVFLPHVWVLFTASLISLGVAGFALQRRKLPLAKILFFTMICIAIWSFAGGVEAGIIGVAQKILWSKISYIGFVFVAPLTFLFIMEFSHRQHYIQQKYMVLLFGISTLTLFLAMTNEYHGLIWSGFLQGSRSANILIYEHGIWYWLFIANFYSLSLVALGFLVGDLKKNQFPYRQQILAICFAAIIPLIGGLIYLLRLSPIPGLDWSPISSVFTGIIFAFIIFRYKFLDLIPVAREVLVDQMTDGMIVLDDRQRIIDINPSARKMLPGGKNIQIGTTLAEGFPDLLFNNIYRTNTSNQTLSIQNKDEKCRYIDIRFSILDGNSAGNQGCLLLLRDITKRKNAEIALSIANQELQSRILEIQKLQSQLREENIRDPLTGLYNRRYMEDALEREFARAKRDGYSVGIIMLDIDHFKKVNDTYGHLVGDMVLQQLTKILFNSFRIEDILCRFGGEEFLIVMAESNRNVVYERSENLRQILENTLIDVDGTNISITISGGIAIFPEDSGSIQGIIKAADSALYIAKSSGRNRVIVSEPSI